jgi:alkylation response protein AidB-like acyl-CoA dehydrogenase
MQFGLSQEQTLLQDSVNKYLNDQVGLDKVRTVAAGDTSDAAIWQGLSELGIPGLMISEANGGVGLGALDAAVISECLGYHAAPSPFISAAAMAPLPLLAANKEEVLGGIATGQIRVGIAFGESIGARTGAGITATGLKLSGKCLFVLDGEADYYLIATTDKKIFMVNVDSGGLKRAPLKTIDATRSTCELSLDKVTAELLSEDPAVYDRTLDMGRVMQAADTLGAAQCMLDQAVAYAGQRKQFNRVIASFQAVKHMCADMLANLEPCRSLVWHAGYAMDDLPNEARMLACHTNAHLSEVGRAVAKTSTEVHGGMGFTDLVGLHYWFKRIGANRQLLGSPELVRQEAARIQGLAA